MKRNYFKYAAAVHLFLVNDGRILLLRRFNTGYEDGNYSVPAGHIDGNERATDPMLREAKEEAGVMISEGDIRMVHVMHRMTRGKYHHENDERIDFFFEATRWEGEPKNVEVDKCDDLRWFPIHHPPQNVVPYVKAALENYQNKIPFSEFGWR